jgi:glucose/arabinose dehydrogenase
MSNGGHSTRTLLIPRTNPDVLLVSRGSDGNLDLGTADVNSGRSQIRIFNISQLRSTPADYSTSGELLGWGLRNSVGVGEDVSTGGIVSFLIKGLVSPSAASLYAHGYL